MTRRPLIAGNWKMNTTLAQAKLLASEIAAGAKFDLDLLVCPPFPWLAAVQAEIAGSRVLLGAQNCWTEPSGAFTGEVAPEMAAEFCTHVIVGHSERRTILGESDVLVAKKVRAALRAGLQPILCVGESLETRQADKAEAFVSGQIHAALDGLSEADLTRCAVAYEPIWAIGTGVSATVDDIQLMSAAIRIQLRSINPDVSGGIRVLYGGSVTPDNFGEIWHSPDVDGALVGGASLKSASFLQLAAIAAN
jgi:triosephosphate isomerase (TIM)